MKRSNLNKKDRLILVSVCMGRLDENKNKDTRYFVCAGTHSRYWLGKSDNRYELWVIDSVIDEELCIAEFNAELEQKVIARELVEAMGIVETYHFEE